MSGIKDNTKETFFVTSYGRTATAWLTHVLNLHDDIYCTHGPALHLGKEATVSVHEQQGDFYALSLDEIINGMQSRVNTRMYGNIHAFTASNLHRKLSSEGISYPYRWVNIIRHPFVRLESFVRQWVRDIEENGNVVLKKNLEDAIAANPTCQGLMKVVNQSYSVDFSNIKNSFFLYSIVQLGNDLSDIEVPCRHIKYEDIFSSTEYFIWFFKYLTNNKMPINENLMQSIKNSKLEGSSQKKGILYKEVIQKWEKWQVMLVRYWLKNSPETVSLYKSLEYELTCIFDCSL